MTKEAFNVFFFVLISLSSLNHISYSKPEENQTVSSDSTPESKQEFLSRGNLSLLSNDAAPILELEVQSLSPDQYANDNAPGHLEDPDVFYPELYSASPFPEALGSQPEANDHNSQITTSATAPPDFALLGMTEVSAEPEAINNSEMEAVAPALSTGSLRETTAVSPQSDTGEFKSQAKPPADAPSTDFTSPEMKAVSAKPEADELYSSQIKSPAPVLSTEVISPRTNRSSAEPQLAPEADANYNSAIKFSAPTPSVAIQLPEMNVASPVPLPSNLFNDYTVEDTDNLAPQSIVDDYNIPTERTESAPSEEPTSPKASQDAPSLGDIDRGVDTPPMINNPSVLPSNYSAEDETFDIVHKEEDNGTRVSWKIGQNNLVMCGVVAGVCFVGLARLVCNCSKKKKKTQFRYQSLPKGF